MSLLKQWTGVTKFMVSDPDTFIDQYDEDHGIGYPVKFLAVSVLATFLPLALLSALANISTPVEAVKGAAIIVGVLGGVALVAGIAEVLLAHGILKLLGAQNGMSSTFEAYTFPSILRFGLWWVPVVQLVGLYGLYLQIKTLASFQNVSTGRSALALILASLLVVPILLVAIAVIGAFVFGFSGGGGVPA